MYIILSMIRILTWDCQMIDGLEYMRVYWMNNTGNINPIALKNTTYYTGLYKLDMSTNK